MIHAAIYFLVFNKVEVDRLFLPSVFTQLLKNDFLESTIYSPVYTKERSARQWFILFLALAKWTMWIRKNGSQMYYFVCPIQKLLNWLVCFLQIGKSRKGIEYFYTLGTWFTGGIRSIDAKDSQTGQMTFFEFLRKLFFEWAVSLR